MGRQAVGRMASWNYAQTEREMCAALGIDAAAALPG
jgi:hypothetical protein